MEVAKASRRPRLLTRVVILIAVFAIVAASCGDDEPIVVTVLVPVTGIPGAAGEAGAAGAAGEAGAAGVDATLPPAPPPEEGCMEMVPFGWLHGFRIQVAASAPIVIALDQGYYEEECLDFSMEITTGSASIRLIAAGRFQGGSVSSAGTLVNFVNDNFPLTSIGLLTQESARTFAVLADSGIERPADFAGKRAGVKVNTIWDEFIAMLAFDEVDPDSIEYIPVGFSSVEMNEGLVDILPVFSGNEPHTLRNDFGLDIRLLDPGDWGFVGVGSMIIINTDYARENPKIVEGFMRATIRGMEFYLENKQESIDIVNKYATPEVAAATERASFLYDVTATQMPRADGCLAYIPPERWDLIISQLIDLELLGAPGTPDPPITQLLYDNSFIEAVYDIENCELFDF